MLLEMQNVHGGYGSGDVVKGISCNAGEGEILCLLGPNGCGKTTLFRLLLGSLPLSKGKILISGRDASTLSARERSKLIAYIPQHHAPVFSYSVLDMVAMGRAPHLSMLHAPSGKDREMAWQALEKVNALHLADRKYTALSGGQRQLVLIARTICQSARIFVMDEPAANLDYANHQLVMEVASELAKMGYCIVMSTHSPEHPASMASKVLLMNDGEATAFGTPGEIITAENLQKTYGIEMDVVTITDRYGIRRTICLPVRKPLPEERS